MYKVSVIIPIYNVEKELACCLDSVLSQTLKDIEIICVNDGSTDNSWEILSKYALFDKRIKLINQENKGLACARNAGLSAAEGEYISFVDSDDWISPLMLERLYVKAKNNNSDVTYCNVIWYNGVTKKYTAVQNGVSAEMEEKFSQITFKDDNVSPALFFEIPCSAWNKLYRKEFLDANSIRFPEGLIFEDVPFFTQIYLKAERISFDKERYYIYRANREGSIIQANGRKYFDSFKIFDISKETLFECNKFEKYKNLWLLYEVKTLLFNLYKIEEELKEEYYNAIQKRYESFPVDEYDLNLLKKSAIFAFFIELLRVDYNSFKPLLSKLPEALK